MGEWAVNNEAGAMCLVRWIGTARSPWQQNVAPHGLLPSAWHVLLLQPVVPVCLWLQIPGVHAQEAGGRGQGHEGREFRVLTIATGLLEA